MGLLDELDDDAVRLMAFRVWNFKQGEQVSLLIHLGDRLGLFRAMAGAGWMTSDELADRSGLDERWVREWVWSMAAAELVAHHVRDAAPADDPDRDRFELSRAAEAVLVDEESSLFFAAGAFTEPPAPDLVAELADSFRTGLGLPYDRLGPSGAHRTERMLGPWARHALVPVVLPLLDGVVDRLREGIDVADVGCGGGVALEAMADAFPRCRFTGLDPSTHAVDRATRRMAAAGHDDVELVLAPAEELPAEPGFDLVLTFDCLHDMTRPDLALAAIRRCLRDDGVLLVKEIRCAPTLEENRHNPMLAMMLGFSITACLSSATSEPGGMGLGTVGLPAERLRIMAEEVGFSSFTEHDPGEPANIYYELRP